MSRTSERALAPASEDPGPICGRPPACKSCSSVRTDRLRSYVRSVVAVAHDRCQDGVRDVSSKQGCGFKCLPLGPTEYLTFSDRSIAHHLLLIEQAPASARSEDCSRAKTAHAFAIVVFAGDLLRWPSDLPRRSSEVRDPEPVHSAGARICGRPPACKSCSSVRTDRLRSYVRSVVAVAHDRCQDGVRDVSSKQGCGFKCLPLGPTEYLTFSDRSIAHHLLLIEQAPASARSEDCSRAKTAHAFAIVVFAGDLLRWPSDLPRRSSEVRDPEPVHSAGARICGRPPACKSCSSVRTDRLRSYVRSVVAVAHDRCQDGVRDVSSKQGCGFKCLPLGPTEYLTFSDRSIAHHLLLIEQAPASARSEDCSRAKTAHAFAIVVFAGDLLRWPSDLPRRSSEVRDPEPVHSAGARICGRPPACKSCSSVRTDRLRSYVRSVVAVAHDRCQDGVRDVSSKQGCGFKCLPLGPTEYLTFSDRSIAHHLLLIEQAPASARSEDCSRAKTAHAFAIVVFAGDLLRWPSDLPRRSSEVRDPEPVHSAGARTSRAPSSAASPAWYREGS